MSFLTYAELQSEMTAWGKRSDLTAKYASFITLAEASILRELKLRVNETTATGTTSGATIAIPTGCDRILRVEITANGVSYTLDYTSPNGIEPLTYSTGFPSRFTVEDGAIRLLSAPADSYTYTVYYIPNLDALSDTNTTNWALTNAPDVYLFGALEQMSHYALDQEQAAKYHGMFLGAMDSVKRVDEARRLPVSGGLQIKPRNAR